jgi:hypothetical protein
MNIDIFEKIKEKAESKKNGVYSFKKHFYLVINKRIAGYSDYFGNVCECAYGFNVSKGKAKDRFEARDTLKKYLKQITCSNL